MSKQVGFVSSLNDLFIVVTLEGYRPAVGEILFVKQKTNSRLLVESTSGTQAFCLNANDDATISQNDIVFSSGKPLLLPAGKPVLGRVFNALGEIIDGEAPFDPKQLPEYIPLTSPQSTTLSELAKPQVLETGIKVIDFMAPFVKGRKIGIIGGAGVGKTVLTTEMMHNVADKKTALSFFVGIGERIREGHELYHTLKDRQLIDSTIMYMGQMNENAALRSLVGPSAARVAQHFAEEGNDILFFVDNIYRFVQARNELAAMRGGIPSEGGYQASLFSDLHRFEDSLQPYGKGSITSVQSIYVPADDLGDPAVVEISQQLDSTIVLSRDVFERGIFPAVDLLSTTSSLIAPEIIGERHYALVGRVRAIMRKHESLRTIIAIVGESELSPLDRKDYERAEAIIQFFNQNMFVTMDLNSKKGEYFTREQTLAGIESILMS